MGRIVVFTLDGALCGLPVDSVREAVRAAWPTPLPGTPAWVLGCVRVADRIHPVIDARVLLGRGRPGVHASDAWLLVEFDAPSIGPAFLAVDALLDVFDASEPVPSRLPAAGRESPGVCYFGVASTALGLVCVPDPARLLDPGARAALGAALARAAAPGAGREEAR